MEVFDIKRVRKVHGRYIGVTKGQNKNLLFKHLQNYSDKNTPPEIICKFVCFLTVISAVVKCVTGGTCGENAFGQLPHLASTGPPGNHCTGPPGSPGNHLVHLATTWFTWQPLVNMACTGIHLVNLASTGPPSSPGNPWSTWKPLVSIDKYWHLALATLGRYCPT